MVLKQWTKPLWRAAVNSPEKTSRCRRRGVSSVRGGQLCWDEDGRASGTVLRGRRGRCCRSFGNLGIWGRRGRRQVTLGGSQSRKEERGRVRGKQRHSPLFHFGRRNRFDEADALAIYGNCDQWRDGERGDRDVPDQQIQPNDERGCSSVVDRPERWGSSRCGNVSLQVQLSLRPREPRPPVGFPLQQGRAGGGSASGGSAGSE